MDNPEQFESQKQQKEIMETGIEMWAASFLGFLYDVHGSEKRCLVDDI
jgi:hypothetical protein